MQRDSSGPTVRPHQVHAIAVQSVPGWVQRTMLSVGSGECAATSGPVLLSAWSLGKALPAKAVKATTATDAGGTSSKSSPSPIPTPTPDSARGPTTGGSTAGSGPRPDMESIDDGAAGGAENDDDENENEDSGTDEVVPIPGAIEILSASRDGKVRVRAWLPVGLISAHEWIERRRAGRFPAVLCLHAKGMGMG